MPREAQPRYPHITCKLEGINGNAFFILGAVLKSLKAGGVSPNELEIFKSDATSGDYDHLLQTCMKWVSVS